MNIYFRVITYFVRPLNVDKFLEQFNPKQKHSSENTEASAATETSPSLSTAYIPTEDEIDKLEEIGTLYIQFANCNVVVI